MADVEPQTVEEARRLGLVVRTVPKDGADLGTILRLPSGVGECTADTVGRRCGESPCLGGSKNIYFCDGTNGCDLFVTVDCKG